MHLVCYCPTPKVDSYFISVRPVVKSKATNIQQSQSATAMDALVKHKPVGLLTEMLQGRSHQHWQQMALYREDTESVSATGTALAFGIASAARAVTEAVVCC